MNGNGLVTAGGLAAGGTGGSSGFWTFLPLLLLVVAFYFFVIRPTRGRQREALKLQSSLAPGQEVMTSSGMYARIESIDGDVVVLQPAAGVHVRWAKAAIARVVTPVAGGSVDAPDTGH